MSLLLVTDPNIQVSWFMDTGQLHMFFFFDLERFHKATNKLIIQAWSKRRKTAHVPNGDKKQFLICWKYEWFARKINEISFSEIDTSFLGFFLTFHIIN